MARLRRGQGCNGSNLFNSWFIVACSLPGGGGRGGGGVVSQRLAYSWTSATVRVGSRKIKGSHPDYCRWPAGARKADRFGPERRRFGRFGFQRWLGNEPTRPSVHKKCSLAGAKETASHGRSNMAMCMNAAVARHRTPHLNGRQLHLCGGFTVT